MSGFPLVNPTGLFSINPVSIKGRVANGGALVDEKPPLVLAVGKGVGLIHHQSKTLSEAVGYRLNLGIHGGALHEDEAAPFPDAFRGTEHGLLHLLHCPGDDARHGPLKAITNDFVIKDLYGLKPAESRGLSQKLGASRSRLGQNYVQTGVSNLQRDSGKSGARPQIEQRRGQLEKVSHYK
jgi:hypothetical protein